MARLAEELRQEDRKHVESCEPMIVDHIDELGGRIWDTCWNDEATALKVAFQKQHCASHMSRTSTIKPTYQFGPNKN